MKDKYNNSILAVDFDGAVVLHEFSKVLGPDVPHAERVLRRLVGNGIKLILWTKRGGEYLDAATKWFTEREIPLFGINENPEEKSWVLSPKCYRIILPDTTLGSPLISTYGKRPYVDWLAVEKLLEESSFL